MNPTAVASKETHSAKDVDNSVINVIKSHKTWTEVLSHLEGKLDGSDTNYLQHYAATQPTFGPRHSLEDETTSSSFSETPHSSEPAREPEAPPDLPLLESNTM